MDQSDAAVVVVTGPVRVTNMLEQNRARAEASFLAERKFAPGSAEDERFAQVLAALQAYDGEPSFDDAAARES
jgi:hypothetical protein